jgi:hypothetical protein
MNNQMVTMMRSSLRRIRHMIALAAVAVALTLVLTDTAWAKPPAAVKEAPPEKSYIVPYVLVALCLGLGITVVCRPASRTDKEKPKAAELED